MRRIYLLIAALALVAPACGELLDPAAAVVNGNKITVEEIAADLERYEASPAYEQLSQQGDPQELRRQVEQQLLSQEIRRAVLAPKAEEFGIEVSESDVEQRLDEIQQDFESEGAFEEALKEQNLTLEQLRELVRDNLLEEQLREEVTEGSGPSDEELRAYYDENIEQFQETEAQHILVEDKATADEIASQLQAAKPNALDGLFARLARRFSTDQSSAADGGSVGFFKPGELVKPFENAAAKLDIGEVSAPVKSEFGFHVIRVTDRRTAPFEEVEAQIEGTLGEGAAEQAWNSYVAKAYEEADVKVNPRYGEFDDETFQVVDATAEDVPGAEAPEAPATPGSGPPAEPPAP